ncbi:hypothetical protein C2S52_005609 [Perilla frutescens var. hirtella]|nr:hypothetical protein C2S52_005609 [Perilla frutescens var. hirtella]
MIGGAAAEKKLYEAASKGDLEAFREVIQEDAYLIEKATFACSRNILHVATMQGQAGIVKEVLRMNPRLARSLDSQNSSPLHISVAEGNFEIMKELLLGAPEMCLSVDCQNMYPIHIAAINGHVQIMKMLLQMNYLPAMERVHRGQTVLHLGVKHCKLEALMVLVEELGELVDAKDENGETILHWAVRTKQLEIIHYLVVGNKIEKETKNSLGKTSLKILREMPRDRIYNYLEIERLLLRLSDDTKLELLPRMSESTMVVVVLIATMAFQAAVSPPGGVWQDDSSTHKAGEAVMASTHPTLYKHFVRANTTAFVTSLITITLLSTGLTSAHLRLLSFAMYGMWMSLTSIAVSYGASVVVITPNTETLSFGLVIGAIAASSLTIFLLLFVWVLTHKKYSSWMKKVLSPDNPLVLAISRFTR